MEPKNKVILTIMIIFILTQILGLYSGIQIINLSIEHPELEETFNIAPAPKDDMMNVAFFVGGVLIGAIIMIFTIKVYHGKFMFKLLELFIVGSGTTVVMFTLFLFTGLELSLTIGLAIGAVIGITRFIREETWIRNMGAVMASAGVGALFGYSLGLIPSIMLAIVLIFYDIFAVFIGKYMITFAKHFSAKNLSFSIVANSGKDENLKISTNEAKKYDMSITKDEEKNGVKNMKVQNMHLELGTGDLVIPLIITVSAYPVLGLQGSLLVMLASILGTLWALKEVTTKRTFLPALPYILTPTLIVLGILYLIF